SAATYPPLYESRASVDKGAAVIGVPLASCRTALLLRGPSPRDYSPRLPHNPTAPRRKISGSFPEESAAVPPPASRLCRLRRHHQRLFRHLLPSRPILTLATAPPRAVG